MYSLRVFHPGDTFARHELTARSADEAMHAIRKLVHDHPGCERVDVYSHWTKLFSVDCEGNRMPD
jgi:hypothetical protein